MKKFLIIILICVAGVVLLAVIGFVFLLFLTRNTVMDGPGMENKSGQDDAAAFSDFEGTWYNRDKSVKLVIKSGSVTEYKLENGQYKLEYMRRAKVVGDRYLQSADKNHPDFGDYSEFVKRGDLLYGPSTEFITDMAQDPDEEFAREGNEDAFAPLPVYVKSADEVSDRQLEEFHMSVNWSDRGEECAFASFGGCEGVRGAYFSVDRTRSGDKKASVSVRDAEYQELIQKDYALSPELEQKLADLLLSPKVLADNPYTERNQMIAPTVEFVLSARFGSGEEIYINSPQGILIGEKKALEIAELLLSGT